MNDQSTEKKHLVRFIYIGVFLFALLAIVGYIFLSKYEISAAGQTKKYKIFACEINAKENYSMAWSTACQKNEKAVGNNLNPDCFLPASTAKKLNDELQKQKSLCKPIE